MRVVIVDRETLEPITVVSVPTLLLQEIEEGLREPWLRLAVPPKLPCAAMPIATIEVRVVEIELFFERDLWIGKTRQGELALTLRAELLPGQVLSWHRAATEGIMKMIIPPSRRS